MINKIKNYFSNFIRNSLRKDNDNLKYMLGSVFLQNSRKNYPNIKKIKDAEYKIFSQTGEDGIIDLLLNKLSIKNPKFVEIGVGDYSESNTRYLYENSFNKGLIVDVIKDFKKKVSDNIDPWKGDLKLKNIDINIENINDVLEEFNMNKDLDLFSLDIDGNDYWILKKIKPKISKIFILEYNPVFGPNLNISIPYTKNFSRFNGHYSGCYYGASFTAMVNLMKEKGYTFIGSNKSNFNAFFINDDYVSNFNVILENLNPKEDYCNQKIYDSRDQNFELNYLDHKKSLLNMQELEVIDLSTNVSSTKTIKELI